MDNELLKELALSDEVEASIKLIKLGLGELQNISPNNNFYYLPFQLLSSGFERFMKCYICMAYKNENDEYPNHKYMKGLGHDLFELLVKINVSYFKVDNRSITIEDKEFLIDEEFVELLGILSEFGKMARYYNLDLITGNAKISIDPKKEWQFFENRIISLHPELYAKLMDVEKAYEVYNFLSNYIVKIFEKFLGALSRQLMFGYVGQKAKQLSFVFLDFGMIRYDNLGKTDYRKLTTRYNETPKKAHKRTNDDELERKFNKGFKSKVFNKSMYQGVWPFYTDEVIIECRYKHWCIVTIEGYDYALNGSAKGRYKLDDPYEGGVLIPGTSFVEFIQITRDL